MNIENEFNKIEIEEVKARAAERGRKPAAKAEVVATDKGKGKIDVIPEIVPEPKKEKTPEPEKEKTPDPEKENVTLVL